RPAHHRTEGPAGQKHLLHDGLALAEVVVQTLAVVDDRLRVRRDREGLAGHELALSRIVLLGESLGVDQLLVDARREPLEHREVLLLFGTEHELVRTLLRTHDSVTESPSGGDPEGGRHETEEAGPSE